MENLNKELQCVLLCRVSSRDQENTGYSLPAQEKLLKEYASKKCFSIKKVFSNAESASEKKQRDTFDEMFQYVREKNINIIICEKSDRLTRGFKSMVIVDEWIHENNEREVHMVKDSLILSKNARSQEKLNWGIRVVLAKNYIDNLSEEVKKGQMEKISQGWLPKEAPLGYKTIDDNGHKIQVIDEGKAIFIRKTFELYSTGLYSLELLTEKMYTLGLRNKKGNKVVKSKIHDLLRKPYYYGKIKWNEKIYNGSQEPLISKSLFDKVNSLLASKNTPKYGTHSYLFKGLIRCNECNGTITWETHKGIVYGHCNHYRQCSQKTWYKDYDVDNEILSNLKNFTLISKPIQDWIKKALQESHKDEMEFYNNGIKQLNIRLQQINSRLDILYEDRLDSRVSLDMYDRKFKEYNDERESILEILKKYNESNKEYYEDGIKIYDISQQCQKFYKESKDIDKKRELINLIFDDLRIDNNKFYYSYAPIFQSIYNAIDETNKNITPIAKFIKDKNHNFEQAKNVVSKSKDGVYSQANTAWLGCRDSNPKL